MLTAIHSTTFSTDSPRVARAERLLDQVVVFNDLADSTPLLVEMGDEAYTALLDELDAARLALLDTHNGRLANLAGDGALMLFPTTDAAIAFARAFNRVCDDLGIKSRTGVHLGDVMRRGNGDLAGVTVHAAARIESTAPAGEILVSAEAAAHSSATFARWGWVELKGLPGATELMELVESSLAAAP